jgi:hypothetical protein
LLCAGVLVPTITERQKNKIKPPTEAIFIVSSTANDD